MLAEGCTDGNSSAILVAAVNNNRDNIGPIASQDPDQDRRPHLFLVTQYNPVQPLPRAVTQPNW